MMQRLPNSWMQFWMRIAGKPPFGRVAAWLAGLPLPPYKGKAILARYYRHGYIAPSAKIAHRTLTMGANVFIGDRVTIFRHPDGGRLQLGDRVHIHQDSVFELGRAGSIQIGADTHIQPRCQFSAYLQSITVGRGVQIAPACGFYPYNHGVALGTPMRDQPLHSRGPIVIEDDVWLGYGVVVLAGVRIGRGAVVGANAVVTRDIPANAIAMGVPARVIAMRGG